MRPRLALPLAAVAIALTTAACPRKTPERPYEAPTAEALLGYLQEQNERARSLRAESTMDYWVGGERARGTVLMMGERGAKVRLNALSPAGDTVAADLACDGSSFSLIDYNADCQLTGPCDASSMARLLRVWLEPDELLLLALGSAPLLDGAEATLTWNANRAAEELILAEPDGRTQRVFLKKSDGHWDVVGSVVEGPGGDTDWELENRDFQTLEAADGAVFRAPQRSRFQQPAEKADLAVRWQEREANTELDPAAFEMSIPPGLRECGA
jgi:hypothetical protein